MYNGYNSIEVNVLYFWKDMFVGYSYGTGGDQNINLYDKDLNKIQNIIMDEKFMISVSTDSVKFLTNSILVVFEYGRGIIPFYNNLKNNKATYSNGVYTVIDEPDFLTLNKGDTLTKDTVIKYDLQIEYSGNNNLKQTKLNEVTLGEYLSTYGY